MDTVKQIEWHILLTGPGEALLMYHLFDVMIDDQRWPENMVNLHELYAWFKWFMYIRLFSRVYNDPICTALTVNSCIKTWSQM